MFTEEQATGYLAGIIDGEGHVNKRHKHISIGNTDHEIIEAIQECCQVLGLNCTVYGPRQPAGNRKPYWETYIRSQESLLRVLETVPLRAGSKRVALSEALTRFKRSPRPAREWLYEKYVVEGLTGPQIAEMCNTSSVRVYKWLRQAGIAVKQGAVPVRIKPPSKDWLTERYVAQGQAPDSIAQELGVSHSTVYRWIHTYEIPIRHPQVNEQ